MSGYCTVHQAMGADGEPYVLGSEVRLPDGQKIPLVSKVTLVADAAERGIWKAVIELPVVFGEPING